MSVRATAGIGPYMTAAEFLAECEQLDSPPRWVGAGAAALGLRGDAAPEDIRAVAAGFHPRTGEPLVRNAGAADKHPGAHVVLAPDKSVSVLFGVAPPDARAEIVACHRAATREALAAAEAWVTARVGAGGRAEVSARFVAFEGVHAYSRALDPHLHSHVGVCGVVHCPADGKTRALQSHQVFDAQGLMEATYQLELGNGLARLGYAVEARDGVAVARDVPRDLCRALSSRAERIEAAVRAHGRDTPEVRRLAATLTRPAKAAERLPALTERWQAVSLEHGFSAEAARVRPAIEPVRPRARGAARPAAPTEFARHAAGLKAVVQAADGLAADRGQFTGPAWQAEATRRAVGGPLSAADVRRAFERVTAKPALYGVSTVPRPTLEPLYTTSAAEQYWQRLAETVRKAATPAARIRAAAAGAFLDVARSLREEFARNRVVVAVGRSAAAAAAAVKEVWSEFRAPLTRVRADKTGRHPDSLARLLADLRPATRRHAHLAAFKALARQPLGTIADPERALRFLEQAFREARRPKAELHRRSVVVVEQCGDATPDQLRELTRRVAKAKARLALVEPTDVPKAAVVELAKRVGRRETPKPQPVPRPVQETTR